MYCTMWWKVAYDDSDLLLHSWKQSRCIRKTFIHLYIYYCSRPSILVNPCILILEKGLRSTSKSKAKKLFKYLHHVKSFPRVLIYCEVDIDIEWQFNNSDITFNYYDFTPYLEALCLIYVTNEDQRVLHTLS